MYENTMSPLVVVMLKSMLSSTNTVLKNAIVVLVILALVHPHDITIFAELCFQGLHRNDSAVVCQNVHFKTRFQSGYKNAVVA